MTYKNTDQLRRYLHDDFPVLEAMESFELDDQEYLKHLGDVQTRPEIERKDAAAFRTLTFNIAPIKKQETKPEQILIQQDQILKAHQAATDSHVAALAALDYGLKSTRSQIADVSTHITELIANEKAIENSQRTHTNDYLSGLTELFGEAERNLAGLAEGLTIMLEEQRAEITAAVTFRKTVKWCALGFLIVCLILAGVEFVHGEPLQNVNPATVVAVCGTAPVPYPAAGGRAAETVDVNGKLCTNASSASTQDVNIVGMLTGIFPVTTSGQSYASALAIQGVTGGIPAPVSPLNDTIRIGGIASGITIPTSVPTPLTIAGTGAAGTATAQAITVQGSASGVALPLSVPQATAGVGTNSALTIQGISGGTAVPTTGTYVQYYKPGTAITFTESGGTVTFTPKNVANGAGRVSNQIDRGSGALSMWFMWEATIKGQSNITIGNPARVYAYCSQTASGSTDYSADAAVTAETQFNNFKLLGSVYSSSTATGPFYAAGNIFLSGEYCEVGLWNATGQTFTNVNGDNKITLTPMPVYTQGAP